MGQAKILGSGSNAPKNSTEIKGYALIDDIPANTFVKQIDKSNVQDEHFTEYGNLFMLTDTIGFVVKWVTTQDEDKYVISTLCVTPFRIDYSKMDSLVYGTTVEVATKIKRSEYDDNILYKDITENSGILSFISFDSLRYSEYAYYGNYILNTVNISINNDLSLSVGTKKSLTLDYSVSISTAYRYVRMGDNGSIMTTYTKQSQNKVYVGGAYFNGNEYIMISPVQCPLNATYLNQFFIGNNYGMVFNSDSAWIYEMSSTAITFLKTSIVKSNYGSIQAYAIINGTPSFVGYFQVDTSDSYHPIIIKINSDLTFTYIQLEDSGDDSSMIWHYCADEDGTVYGLNSGNSVTLHKMTYTTDNKVLVKKLSNKSFVNPSLWGVKKSNAYWFCWVQSQRYIEKVQRMGKTYAASDDAIINGITKSKLSVLTPGKIYIVSNADTQLINGIPIATVKSIKDTTVDEIKNAVISEKENENEIL
nr:MAG TPA: hypothetical protein [Caudoviricetes sp.]